MRDTSTDTDGMFKNIALGVYYPGDSPLHRLQARTKLLVIFWLVVVLLIAGQNVWHFAPYAVLVLMLVLGVAASGISPRHIWQRMWLLTLLALLGMIPVLLFPGKPDSHPLYTTGLVLVSYGLIRWVIVAYSIVLFVYMLLLMLPVPLMRVVMKQPWLRRTKVPLFLLTLVALIYLWLIRNIPQSATAPVGPLMITHDSVWTLMTFFTVFLTLYALSLLLTMTTSPVALIEGLTLLLAPLRRLRLPVDDFALMTLLALRFIPTLIDEAEQLVKAQTSRGADFSQGTIRERLQSMAMLFIPFMQGALRRATDLATALESRGYEMDGEQTQLHEQAFAVLDYAVLGGVVLVTVGALLL
jgi:energy-coupling factor transport system permease protein